MISKSVSEDTLFFKSQYQKLRFSGKAKRWKKRECVSWRFMLRFLFRLMDILWRVLTLLLTWTMIGGFTLITVVLIESLFLISFSVYCKDSSILTWILKSPLEKPEFVPKLSKYVNYYRWILHLLLIIAIWIFSVTQFSCGDETTVNFCTKYNERNSLMYDTNNYGFGTLLSSIFCSIGGILIPLMYLYLEKNAIYTNKIATVDRKLDELLKLQDFNGVSELIEFGFIFDKTEYLKILFHKNYQFFGYQTLWDILWLLDTKYQWFEHIEADIHPSSSAEISRLLTIVSNILKLDTGM